MDEPQLIAYVAIGSNQGNARVQTLRALRTLVATDEITLHNWSHNYRSAPLLVADNQGAQDWYQNLVACISTALSPQQLLDCLLAIEVQLGRVRNTNVRWQSRIIDLDLLLLYKVAVDAPHRTQIHSDTPITIRTPRLQVPHPEIAQRNFVLAPLAELLSPLPDFLPQKWHMDGLQQTTIFSTLCVQQPHRADVLACHAYKSLKKVFSRHF